MATLISGTADPSPAERSNASPDRGAFFTNYAALCLAIAVLGFAPSFWYPITAGSFGGTGMIAAHGILFTAWPVLFFTQTLLVERRRISRHRAWGVLGVSLATMMLLVGIATVEAQLTERLAAGFGDRARSFTITPLTNIVLFFGFFAAAVANVGRPDWHKRLMMVASAIVLLPAFARFFFILVDGRPIGPLPSVTPPGVPEAALRPGSLVILLMAGAALVDRRRLGKVHPAWSWGIGVFAAVALARIPLSRSDAWLAIADVLVAFG